MLFYRTEQQLHILEGQERQIPLEKRLEKGPIPIEEVEVIHYIGVDAIPLLDSDGNPIVRINEVNGLDAGSKGASNFYLSYIKPPDSLIHTTLVADQPITNVKDAVIAKLFSPTDRAIGYFVQRHGYEELEDVTNMFNVPPLEMSYLGEYPEKKAAAEDLIARQLIVERLLNGKLGQADAFRGTVDEYIETFPYNKTTFETAKSISSKMMPPGFVVAKPNFNSAHGDGILFIEDFDDPRLDPNTTYSIQPYYPSKPIPNPSLPGRELASNFRWCMFVIKLRDGSEHFIHVGGYNRTMPYHEGKPVKINRTNKEEGKQAHSSEIPKEYIGATIEAIEKIGKSILSYVDNTPINEAYE